MKGQDEGGRKGSRRRRRSGWPFSTIRSDSPMAAPPTVIGANPQSCSAPPMRSTRPSRSIFLVRALFRFRRVFIGISSRRKFAVFSVAAARWLSESLELSVFLPRVFAQVLFPLISFVNLMGGVALSFKPTAHYLRFRSLYDRENAPYSI